MIISAEAGRGSQARPQSSGIRRWTLWSIDRRGLAFLLIVDALSVVLSAAAWQHPHLASADIGRLWLLFGLSAIYAEATDRVARLRNYLHTDRGVLANQNSIVCFAGLLLLPLPGALLLAILVYSHLLIRSHRHQA